jgi:DNA-binding LacI/PurR family transcriptional regulator
MPGAGDVEALRRLWSDFREGRRARHHDVLLGSPAAVYDQRSSCAFRFRQGFEHAGERLSLAGFWYPVGPSYQSTREVLLGHFAEHQETTGVVVHNEAILPEVLAVLAHEGPRVSDDLSVVGASRCGGLPARSAANVGHWRSRREPKAR